MLKAAIEDVSRGRDLAKERIALVFEEIFAGRATQAQIGALLIALRMKGETAAEVTGAATALRQRARTVRAPAGRVVLDTCGTGGDGAGTFNISTAVALVVAAAGVTVAKHGNTRISSQSGSADVLTAAGVSVDVSIPCVERCLAEVGLAFLLAPLFHPVMREVSAVRRELGVRSIFNVLGPLANPARADRQIVGVYDGALVPIVAAALRDLGTTKSLVVHGDDGLDEVSPCGPTRAMLVTHEGLSALTLYPEDADVARLRVADLAGGDPAENARLLRRLLAGGPGPLREAVVLNAAAALWVADAAPDLRSGAARARAVLDDGSAARKLEALVEMTSRPLPAELEAMS